MAGGHLPASPRQAARGGVQRPSGAAWVAAGACVAAGAVALLSPGPEAARTVPARADLRLDALVAGIGTEGRAEHAGSARRPQRSVAETLAELRLYDAPTRFPGLGPRRIARPCVRPLASAYFWSPPRACSSAAPMRRPAS
jgi:hypothetical protein